MNSTTKTIIGVLIAAVLVIGGIFIINNNNNKNEETSQTESSSQESNQASTIATLASNNPDLSTLVTALGAAGLVETLNDTSKEYTVFAPNNAAFTALPAGTVEDLLKPENKEKLTSILTYHVVEGKALSSGLENGQKIKTVQGQELTVRISDDKVYINEAQVVTPDVTASNGVVHVINAVLIPQ